MINWLLSAVLILLLVYVILLKRELRRLKTTITTLSERQAYGGRLSLEFREKNLLEVVDALNVWIDEVEKKGQVYRESEENIKLTIAGLSHDLRTPLTTIKGYVQLLPITEDPVKRAQYITIIEQAIARLLSMTDQFYDLTRIETKQKEMELRPILFSTEVEEVLFSFYEQFRERGIEIEFLANSADRTVLADRIMLTRVIQNVAQNLLRYAEGHVTVTFLEASDAVTLQVINHVKPGTQVHIEKIFQRFYTENTSRSNTEASGLGLYLSKKLVEGMGGMMTAQLSDDKFTLLIKLKKGI
ncbi:HAMP domain-containing sensor histidine kinase [Enterococcus dongliensis]|uniref:histidine kinase n=1 Tax=Enterococcus dongliensis TaxID=2559925 RepID=A0AAP5NIF6_9ENTE|nr:HAMP domain-containing sensor histidine kinase [Enterococcus dongliensis]MDT2596047.1 HAMP domain-containing sensor histidine kinase [Enterococcus dongliensis]MDT2603489.1 HAMP domain-containing sensor histidine kinase [Enterococcus dongliensis]MDT2634384.1 HAMP domain-containing sensor histidine kinase [Enterococcus dongliensis]MDT2636901.1 HAMP domain-containing sensor histidine kinase [Enterococcus dongliensis]MDT2642005.1 HAMP domain-containing sensor histidine kinase [Enterococcus dong